MNSLALQFVNGFGMSNEQKSFLIFAVITKVNFRLKLRFVRRASLFGGDGGKLIEKCF